MQKRKREPYESITFPTTPDMRARIRKLMDETGYPASKIVFICLEHSLKRAKLQAKKELVFE